MTSQLTLPRDYLSPIAKAYETLGYRVVREPAIDELPDFLKPFQPDLIARRPGDNIAVELRGRVQDKSLSYWMKLEAALKKHSDWHLELVDPGVLTLDITPGSEPIDTEAVQARIDQARQLLNANSADLALIAAFSALEAVMRSVVDRKKLSWDTIREIELTAELLDAGYLTADDTKHIRNMQVNRNAIAHGFSLSNVDRADVERLIEVTNELAKEL
jgi:hypothetical protein